MVRSPEARDRLALGTRCADSNIGMLAEPAEIMRDLWACRSSTGVRAVGGQVQAGIPLALQEAVWNSPVAAKAVLTAEPADDLPQDTVNWASGGNNVAAPK